MLLALSTTVGASAIEQNGTRVPLHHKKDPEDKDSTVIVRSVSDETPPARH